VLKTAPAADLTLLDRLPLFGDILSDLPSALKACLFAAFDIWVLWNAADGGDIGM
jgi:hypothetical protein